VRKREGKKKVAREEKGEQQLMGKITNFITRFGRKKVTFVYFVYFWWKITKKKPK
jgi:hypothetical protein